MTLLVLDQVMEQAQTLRHLYIHEHHQSGAGTIEIPYELSNREAQVIQLAAKGLTDEGICAALGIAPGTLGTYWARIRNKSGQMARTEIAVGQLQRHHDLMTVRYFERLASMAERESLFLRAADLDNRILLRLDSAARVEMSNQTALDEFGLKRLVGLNIHTLFGKSADLIQRAINFSRPDAFPIVIRLSDPHFLDIRWLMRRDKYLKVVLVSAPLD